MKEKNGNEDNISEDTFKSILNKYGTINYEPDGTTMKSLTTAGKKSYEISINDLYSGPFCSVRPGIKVGDYIDYTPDSASDYSVDKLDGNNTGSYYNYSDIPQENLKWQVLRIYNDGKMDLISTTTSKGVQLMGEQGYNNGINVLNDVCKTLYSKSTKGITARSINIDDIEYWLTDTAKNKKNEYPGYYDHPTYGGTKTYTNEKYTYYPNIFPKEKGSKIDSNAIEGMNQEVGRKDGLGLSEEGLAMGLTKSNGGLTATQTYYNLDIDDENFGDKASLFNNSTYYWIASRYTNCDTNEIRYGLNYAHDAIKGNDFFMSDGTANWISFEEKLRAVVTLGEYVQVTASTNASDPNGTPHQITQY